MEPIEDAVTIAIAIVSGFVVITIYIYSSLLKNNEKRMAKFFLSYEFIFPTYKMKLIKIIQEDNNGILKFYFVKLPSIKFINTTLGIISPVSTIAMILICIFSIEGNKFQKMDLILIVIFSLCLFVLLGILIFSAKRIEILFDEIKEDAQQK